MEKTNVLKAFHEAQEKERDQVKSLSALGDLSAIHNTSGIRAVGHAVLLLPYKPDIDSSTIYVPETVSRQMDMYEMRGIVVEVGPDAFPWWKRILRTGSKRCERGDKVLVSKFCGAVLVGPADGQQYRMVNAADIFAVITSESDKVAAQPAAPRIPLAEVVSA